MSRAPIPVLARRLATVLAGALIVATAATLAARQSWLFELFSHFRWQYVVSAAIAIPVLWLSDRRVLTLACVAAFAIHAFALIGLRFGPVDHPPAGTRPLRILSFNVYYRNADYPAVAGEIERLSPDIVCLYETTEAWKQHLAAIAARYAFSLFTGDGPHSGLACLSRIVPLKVIPPDADARSAPWMQLELESRGVRFRVIAVHLAYPLGATAVQVRNRQLLALGRELREIGEPLIVVGDFNLTPYSPYNSDFLAASSLHDCSRGRALQPTWPSWFAPLWMEIDRCFVDARVAVAGYRVGPSLGSDHYALVIDFDL
jgi:endonuclease/exonuclease/phosphatase (EEP) superfamily protein YafD